jgi:putative spermidine/putrescine transport system ATP-binding protein
MQYEIKQIHRDLGVTIVYVTHDQSEALAMSDRIAIFQNGDIVQIDSPHDLYERPANVYVAGFIGENNILAGSVERQAGGGAIAVKLPCGREVTAKAAGADPATGAKTTLTVRPDRLIIGNDAPSLGNSLPGRVLDVTYLGDHFRAQIDIGGDQKIVVRRPSGQLSGKLESGDEILVGWRVEDGLVFL